MSPANKIGDIYLTDDGTQRSAFLRSNDGTSDIFLCAINLGVYERHASIREHFANFVAEVAVNLSRAAGAGLKLQMMPVVQASDGKIDRTRFDCWRCTHPQGVEARHCLNSFSDDDLAAQLTPRGNLLACCRVAATGAMPR
jgi:hypothetical protein